MGLIKLILRSVLNVKTFVVGSKKSFFHGSKVVKNWPKLGRIMGGGWLWWGGGGCTVRRGAGTNERLLMRVIYSQPSTAPIDGMQSACPRTQDRR